MRSSISPSPFPPPQLGAVMFGVGLTLDRTRSSHPIRSELDQLLGLDEAPLGHRLDAEAGLRPGIEVVRLVIDLSSHA